MQEFKKLTRDLGQLEERHVASNGAATEASKAAAQSSKSTTHDTIVRRRDMPAQLQTTAKVCGCASSSHLGERFLHAFSRHSQVISHGWPA